MNPNSQSKIARTLREEARADALRIRKANSKSHHQHGVNGKRENGKIKKNSQELILNVNLIEEAGGWISISKSGKRVAKPPANRNPTPVKQQQTNMFSALDFPELNGDERGDFQSPRPMQSKPGKSWASIANDPAPEPSAPKLERQIIKLLNGGVMTTTPDAWSDDDAFLEYASKAWKGKAAIKNGSWADECESDSE